MDGQDFKTIDKTTKAFVWTNLGLLAVTNFLVYATWYNVVSATVDTMFFGGLTLIILFFTSVYYLLLLNWGVRLHRQMDNPNKNISRQSIFLLIMNIVPMSLVYFLTT